MQISKKNIFLFLIVAIIWELVITYPLILYFSKGIPSSARNVEKNNIRMMIPGDHLQLFYYFWLTKELLSRNIPLFKDIYQFNRNLDYPQPEFKTYYLPYSLIFSGLYHLFGGILAWNLTILISVLLLGIGTYCLMSMYTKTQLSSFFAGLISISVFPLWVYLLGGSPSGFAISVIPYVYLGICNFLVSGRLIWGAMTGIFIILLFSSDMQIFYFVMLFLPLWCIIVLIDKDISIIWRKKKDFITGSIPVILSLIVVLLFIKLTEKRLEGSLIAKGTGIHETAIYSPDVAGFLFSLKGKSAHIHIGWVVFFTLIIGITIYIFLLCRKRYIPNKRVFILICLSIFFICILAVGINGPFNGICFRICRKFIPYYGIVRQPAKVFSLTPVLFGLMAGMSMDLIIIALRNTFLFRYIFILLSIALITESALKVDPTICLLDSAEGAYEVIKKDSISADYLVLGIPLWPGNSHWASPLLYYVTAHRFRMMNGYKPTVSMDYINDVFVRFRSINCGILTDEQADELYKRGVRYIVLNEDMFPEPVSIFPVGVTLVRLLNHKRLKLLKGGSRAWIFKLFPSPRDEISEFEMPSLLSSARLWEAEKLNCISGKVEFSEGVSGGGYLRILPHGRVEVRTRGSICNAENLRWSFRIKGEGKIITTVCVVDDVTDCYKMCINSNDWEWKDSIIHTTLNNFKTKLIIECQEGFVDIDLVTLIAGALPGEEVVIMPAWLFHAGYTDENLKFVHLEPLYDPDVPLYGPRLPIKPGRYKINVEYLSTKKDIGEFVFKCGGSECGRWKLDTPEYIFDIPYNLPFSMEFNYNREAPVIFKHIKLKRLGHFNQ